MEMNPLKTWGLGEILQEPVQSVQLRKEPTMTKMNSFFAEEPSLFLSVPMSTNDHYFDNIDLTSHTTLPRASVADIDSLFLARPARAAREKGSNYSNYKTQLFKIQNTQSTLVQYKKYLKLTVLYSRLIPAQCVIATTSGHQGLLVVVVHLYRPDFHCFCVF